MLDHLIVDGYNVLHAGLRGRAASRGAIDVARQTLLRELETAAAQRGIHCTVVFDGAPIEDVTHASSKHLTVLFSGPRSTADAVIERLVCHAKVSPQGTVPEIVVATDDQMEGNLVIGWGAHVWSSAMLAQWLRELDNETTTQ